MPRLSPEAIYDFYQTLLEVSGQVAQGEDFTFTTLPIYGERLAKNSAAFQAEVFSLQSNEVGHNNLSRHQIEVGIPIFIRVGYGRDSSYNRTYELRKKAGFIEATETKLKQQASFSRMRAKDWLFIDGLKGFFI